MFKEHFINIYGALLQWVIHFFSGTWEERDGGTDRQTYLLTDIAILYTQPA